MGADEHASRPRRRLAPILGVIVLIAGVAVAAIAFAQGGDSGSGADGSRVGVSPAPGTPTASPRTEISFRGIAPDKVGEVTVTGSQSGGRSGRVIGHSDGQGASFVLSQPLRAGEEVTVRTALNVAGGTEGDWSFRTVARPKAGLQSGGGRLPRTLAAQLFGQRGKPPAGSVPRYRSEPGLRPPEVRITRRVRAGTGEGLLFMSPKKVFGARKRAGLQNGPLLFDNAGEPVWFANLTDGNVNDFRMQTYKGKPVISWWQGRQILGTGEGTVTLLDQSYRPVKRIRAGNGYALDFHESTITEKGTFLGLVYSPVSRDLRSIGGPRNGRVVDSVVQEIDIETGRVMFEWHSLQHVPLKDSFARVPPSPRGLYDYFHINSVREDTDGNLIVSGRETHGVYKIDRVTGEVIWTLGGKSDDFKLAKKDKMAFQHDAQRDPDGTIRVFDNEAAPRVQPQSRVIWYRLDEQNKRATVARQFRHPDRLSSGTQGNAQRLQNGNTVIGWGSQGYFTEIDARNRVLVDGRVDRGNDSYRAYRFDWTGTPREKPRLAAQRRGSRTVVWASWNGATEVASWEVLAGDSADALSRVGERRRTGFETAISARTTKRFIAVRAKDAEGKVLATSAAQRARSGS
jgi:hypothetical protein